MPVYRQSNLPRSVHLTDEEYKRALLKFPKYCHDVIIMSGRNFFLAERRHDKTPSGPWFIGGQVAVFQEIEESLSRLFRRETKLDIEPDLFWHFTRNRYFFDGSDGGVPHDAICEIFVTLLSQESLDAIELNLDEYAQPKLVEYDRARLSAIENEMTRRIFLDLWDEIDERR